MPWSLSETRFNPPRPKTMRLFNIKFGAGSVSLATATAIKLQAQLREEQDSLVKALAEKTNKEAKWMGTGESIAAARVRVEEFRRNLEYYKAKKGDYVTTTSHQSEVLDCDPHLDGSNELIQELNENNGLFKFVRTMRKKFREAAGCCPCIVPFHPMLKFGGFMQKLFNIMKKVFPRGSLQWLLWKWRYLKYTMC